MTKKTVHLSIEEEEWLAFRALCLQEGTGAATKLAEFVRRSIEKKPTTTSPPTPAAKPAPKMVAKVKKAPVVPGVVSASSLPCVHRNSEVMGEIRVCQGCGATRPLNGFTWTEAGG